MNRQEIEISVIDLHICDFFSVKITRDYAYLNFVKTQMHTLYNYVPHG